jgi:hypothetical protein
LNNSQSLVGKRLKDLDYSGSCENGLNLIRIISEYVNYTGKSVRSISTLRSDDQKCYLAEESLIYDPVSKNKIGRFITVQNLDQSLIAQILSLVNVFKTSNNYSNKLISANDLLIGNTEGLTTLTQREHEVLFLLLMGESYKSIAMILSTVYSKNIKETAIRDVIHRQLFIKLHVNTVEELKQYALKYSMKQQIPHSILANMDGVISASILN